MVNVAIAGIGNVASALVQGTSFYNRGNPVNKYSGMLPEIKEVPMSEVQFVLGFDVNKWKIGTSLSDALLTEPNCVRAKYIPHGLYAPVLKGPVLDGLDSAIAKHVPVDKNQRAVDVEEELRKYKADVLVITIPTGAQRAAEHYARAAIKAGCAVVNGMPASIANNPDIIRLAEKYCVPIIGDDVKSQVGATIVHRALANLFSTRGAMLDRTIQLDWGGDMDFCNLMSNARYEKGKREGKTESVISDQPNKDSIDVRVSAADYIPFLRNQKEAYIRLEGRIFGSQAVRIDVTMQVQDGYNSAGVLVDMIRVAQIARNRKIGGVLKEASAFFNKRPPKLMPDAQAKRALLEFLKER